MDDGELFPETAAEPRDAVRERAETVRRSLERAGDADATVARRTAAWIWGLDVLPPGADPREPPLEVIGGARAGPPAPPWNDPERVPLPAGHVAERGGVRLTTPARTALDCARWLPRADAVAALDQFLRRGATVAGLRDLARPLDGYRRSDRLRAVLRAGDAGAQSPGESRTRVLLVDAGLPVPATQIPVAGPDERYCYVDLGYERFRVGVEYDGERHHTGARSRAHDERRRRWLREEEGWEFITVTREVRYAPAPYVEAVVTALLRRGWNPPAAALDRVAARLAHLRRRPR
ncbi:hypothetical protein [Actinomadura atramentaria]|uniref:hypothetical protein n=1 Tax=Actinomadura atramentaria TaxID=1990 RepID=UPI00036A6576|nr:hypothetical protein [Actinomadura atramentaria]